MLEDNASVGGGSEAKQAPDRQAGRQACSRLDRKTARQLAARGKGAAQLGTHWRRCCRGGGGGQSRSGAGSAVCMAALRCVQQQQQRHGVCACCWMWRRWGCRAGPAGCPVPSVLCTFVLSNSPERCSPRSLLPARRLLLPLLQNGLTETVNKSRKQIKERKNRSKSLRGVKKGELCEGGGGGGGGGVLVLKDACRLDTQLANTRAAC